MRRAIWVLVAAALVAVLVIGLSQAGGQGSPEDGPAYDHEDALAGLEGAPAPLAALHRQQSALLDGGVDAFGARLDELRGHPVVVNKWGSWCTPCRAEFPVFQRVSARKGKTVAFLGVNGGDNRESAEEFLAERPLSYPSYVDERGAVAKLADLDGPFPLTAFIDRKGDVAFVHAGPYRTDADLEADIRRYLGA